MIARTLCPAQSHQNHALMDHSQWFLCLLPLCKAPQWHLQCQNVEWNMLAWVFTYDEIQKEVEENMSNFVDVFSFKRKFACGIPYPPSFHPQHFGSPRPQFTSGWAWPHPLGSTSLPSPPCIFSLCRNIISRIMYLLWNSPLCQRAPWMMAHHRMLLLQLLHFPLNLL